MKQLFLIGILLLIGSAYAQVNQVDSKGRKQGPWEKVHPGTRVYQYKGQFKDDKPVGKFTYYYESSKVKAIVTHDDLTGRSEANYYHENGLLMSHGIYRNMKKDSVWTNYSPLGRLSSKESYKNDSLHGQKVVFFLPEDLDNKSRIVSAIYNYDNGRLNGEVKEFFETGVLMKKGQYLNNRKVGVWEDYHPNGVKSAEYRYKNGIRHGWAYVYSGSGAKINSVYFYYGKQLEGEVLKEKLQYLKSKGINPND